MKKLRLNLEQLKNAEVLTRSQLRNVLGGMDVPVSDSRRCWGSCSGGSGDSAWISGCGSDSIFVDCGCNTGGATSSTCSNYPN